MFKNLHKYRKNRGVTMVELIVVIAIVAILSGMMFFDYGKFKSSTSLQNLADDIALSVRKAQMYAVGARGVNGNNFDYGYGVHFTIKSPTNNINEGSNKAFILFVDMNTSQNKSINGYDYPNDISSCGTITMENECLEILSITGADYISEIKVIKGNSPPDILNQNSVLDIVYTRPNTTPTICYRNNPNNPCNENNKMSQAIITVKNDNSGTTKTVTIYNNGQISVS